MAGCWDDSHHLHNCDATETRCWIQPTTLRTGALPVQSNQGTLFVFYLIVSMWMVSRMLARRLLADVHVAMRSRDKRDHSKVRFKNNWTGIVPRTIHQFLCCSRWLRSSLLDLRYENSSDCMSVFVVTYAEYEYGIGIKSWSYICWWYEICRTKDLAGADCGWDVQDNQHVIGRKTVDRAATAHDGANIFADEKVRSAP